MAEQQDDKKLMFAGLALLATLIGGLLVYHNITLKTSRPIDKEKANHLFLEEGQVPARLWQDPFEAVETYELSEAKRRKDLGLPYTRPNVDAQIEKIRQIIVASPRLLVLPVFMDGSPYSSGAENRLNDRYAVVSALGAAGYMPESGEHIRFFKYSPGDNPLGESRKDNEEKHKNKVITIPVELFIPKKKLEGKQKVMVLWLKEQELGKTPLRYMLALLEKFKGEARPSKSEQDKSKIGPTYKVLGPRFSTGLSAMLNELQTVQAEILRDSLLKEAEFYSPWATIDDIFLLPQPLGPSDHLITSPHGKTIEKIFDHANIKLIRTIKTDTALAEQLLLELKRREVALRPCADKDCNPRVALISEWDTLYGRALPRTFTALVMNGGFINQELEIKINKLRRDEWPKWISHHSYLAGLDGELPAKSNDKQVSETQAKNMAEHGNQRVEQEAAERPEGRSQLDYVRRLAASLKQEQDKNGEKGEFKAIGVLGGDVYDKLLILQALRPTFPRAIFFTTDLNARLTYPAEWEWTRNLIVASHFGLELREELQTPIPPFRDSYQTSVFYAALRALGHFVSPNGGNPVDCPDCFFNVNRGGQVTRFSTDVAPRLYEIGRRGAFDISTDPPRPSLPDYTSIHPARPDLVFTDEMLKKTGLGVLTATLFVVGGMLLSSTIATMVIKIAMSRIFWLITAIAAITGYGVAQWMILKVPMAANEPFTISDGISAWPAMIIGLLALFMSIGFLWYCWKMLKDNENALTHEFDLAPETFEKWDGMHDCGSSEKPSNSRGNAACTAFAQRLRRFVGLHFWKPSTTEYIEVRRLWRHYTELGNWKNVAARSLPQLIVALCIPFLLMYLFGFPNTPCRGAACFTINNIVIFVTVPAMVILMFYVVDATRLCRRWVNCIGNNKVYWPDEILKRKSAEQHGDKENLGEWLGIEVIARRTEVIGNFVYFPFIILVILGITRHGYFDNWDFPLALVLIFIVDGIIIFVNAVALRRSANMAKREAIKRLESRLIPLSDQIPGEIKQRQQIEWTVNLIRKNQRGAFLPFTQHPIFGAAIALPSGGYGLVLLLEYLATGF